MRPALILQMQRMGDLVLTFPLLLWLQRQTPGRELWVVGEEAFFQTLYPLSPPAVYFPWSAADRLAQEDYSLVVNLSLRDEAARLLGRLRAAGRAETVLGAEVTEEGFRRMHGRVQLYRAALVEANRHNRFHWADLNALDLIPLAEMAATQWPAPRTLAPTSRSVGVFLGASEVAKRPEAEFYAALGRELAALELLPVLLGGPAEADLGRAVAAALQTRGIKVLNYAGQLQLNELARIGQTMQLLITPDTGPMHLAAWSGLKVLNLSMGPVNPWETGPYQPGHWVLQAVRSCAGCWSCGQRDLACRQTFDPRRVARLAATLARGHEARLQGLRLPGQRLLATDRDQRGLYRLRPIHPDGATARDLLADFWQAWAGTWLRLWPDQDMDASWERLRAGLPRLATALTRALPTFARGLKAGFTSALPKGFWALSPPMLRPLSSVLHLLLENGDYGRSARAESLTILEQVVAITSHR